MEGRIPGSSASPATSVEADGVRTGGARELAVGDRVEAVVTGLSEYGAFVVTREGHRGLIHISEVSDWYVENVRDYFTVGESVTVEVVGREAGTGKYAFSTRRLGGKQPLSSDYATRLLAFHTRPARGGGRRVQTGRREGSREPSNRGGAGSDRQLILAFLQRRFGNVPETASRELGQLIARHGAVRVALAVAEAVRRFDAAPPLLNWVGKQLAEPRAAGGAGAPRP